MAAEPLFPEIFRDEVFRLETPRLWLHWPRLSDAAAIEAMSSFREVAEMTARVPHPYPAGSAAEHIAHTLADNAAGALFGLALTLKTGERALVGRISLGAREGEGFALGYMMHPGHWGCGYVSEAVRAMLDAAFAFTRVREVHAEVRTVNPASRRVLEKAGFAFYGKRMSHGPARATPHEVDMSVLARGAWEGRRGLQSLGRGEGRAEAGSAG